MQCISKTIKKKSPFNPSVPYCRDVQRGFSGRETGVEGRRGEIGEERGDRGGEGRMGEGGDYSLYMCHHESGMQPLC